MWYNYVLCGVDSGTTLFVWQDHKVLPVVIERIKERLRGLSKLDVLSMPFRVSFVRVGSYR